MAGHFSGSQLYSSLARSWWWEGMFSDASEHCRSCPQCAIVTGGGRAHCPFLHPIPVQRAFQIVGLDIMELPRTNHRNQYVVVFQDFLTKWPMVFPVPDQKAVRIVRLFAEELVPVFGVPEALLTDRGTNLLAHLMKDVCRLLGTKKLNTTAYHPQCDGMVERFNHTLKAMLREHATKFGAQWDIYLHSVLWAYCNTPHESTREKPSFLLFGFDCCTPTEAMWLPPGQIQPANLSDYREQLLLSMTSARELAATQIQKAQKRYKAQYDKESNSLEYQLGDWALVKFPQEESGKQRKLSRPWHGPYRVTSRDDPDLTLVKVYFPQEGTIQVHQTRVKPCPNFPAGYYWYGPRRRRPGRPPKWVDNVLAEHASETLHEDLPDTEIVFETTADIPPSVNPSVDPPSLPARCHKKYSLRPRPVLPQLALWTMTVARDELHLGREQCDRMCMF